MKRYNQEITDIFNNSTLTLAKSQLKITLFFNNEIHESLPVVLLRMTARDGITYIFIITITYKM